MTHIVYCHFHLLSKSFLPFLFIWSIWSPIEKSIQEKTIIPIILKIKKSSKNCETCSVPKNLPGESLFWTLFSTVQENWVGIFRKSQLVYLGKKEREAISAIRITVIQDAESLGIVLILEVTSDKESTTDHELANCSNVFDIATYKRRQVCVTIKKYIVNKPPYIQIRLFTAKENEAIKQVACQLYFERFPKNVQFFMRLTLCLLRCNV